MDEEEGIGEIPREANRCVESHPSFDSVLKDVTRVLSPEARRVLARHVDQLGTTRVEADPSDTAPNDSSNSTKLLHEVEPARDRRGRSKGDTAQRTRSVTPVKTAGGRDTLAIPAASKGKCVDCCGRPAHSSGDGPVEIVYGDVPALSQLILLRIGSKLEMDYARDICIDPAQLTTRYHS
jgi:hypothetical protein